MATKLAYIQQAKASTDRFLKHFRASKRPLDVFERKREYGGSPLASIYQAGAKELCFRLLGSTDIDETFHARIKEARKLSSSSMNSVRSSMEQAVGEELLKLESQMIFLATAVSGAPFLGLLGTVWGVMDAFSGVAIAGNAQLSALAPGVSGALLTTVVALLVALPAMFGYNYIITTIRVMTVEMENFSAECASQFEHSYGNLE